MWTVGLSGGILFFLLKSVKIIEVRGYRKNKFDSEGRGLVLISNHPSLYEPVILPFLFFPHFLFSKRFIPFSTPDKKNYYDKWWFWLFRKVCIPIQRGQPKKELETIEAVIKPFLRRGGVLILYPEGRRTFKSKDAGVLRRSSSGKEIGIFPRGIRRLFYNADFKVLPVWVEHGQKIFGKTRIIIGEPFIVKSLAKEEITSYLENILLELAERAE